MANKKISELTPKGATIGANDLIEIAEYVSPGVFTTKSVKGSELGGGASAFTELSDVPASYVGQTLKFVRVNAGETALEFATVSVSDTNIANTDLTLPTGTRKLIFGGATTADALAFRNSTDTNDLFRLYGNGGWIFRNNTATSFTYFDGNNTWQYVAGSGAYQLATVVGLYTTHTYSGASLMRNIMANTSNILYNNGNFQVEDTASTVQTSGSNGIALQIGTAPTASSTDRIIMYAADITAGNAAPHFRTENGSIVKLYQETTGVTASTFVANTSGIADDTATFDGYTLGQVVKALRNLGILA